MEIRVSGGSPANTHATSKIEGVRQVNLLGMGVKSGAQSITWTSGIIPSQELRGYCLVPSCVKTLTVSDFLPVNYRVA